MKRMILILMAMVNLSAIAGNVCVVSNTANKKIISRGLFGGDKVRYRYFFSMRNISNNTIRGTVKIGIGNKRSGVLRSDEWDVDMRSNGGGHGYIQASTSPSRREHGDSAFTHYKYVVKNQNGQTIARGVGRLIPSAETTHNQ